MTENNSASMTGVAARLLGPAQHEIGCEQCFDLLDSYVELELVGADADGLAPGMRAHLEGCAACRNDHESLLALLRRDGG